MFEFRHQPLKALFCLYSAIIILFIRAPYWIILSSNPAWRQRPSWSMSRSFMVRLMNSFMGIVFATGAFEFDIADTETNAKSADKLRFVWVDGIPDDFVLGEIAAMAKVNGVYPVRISGYWYGKRGRDGKHAQRASPGEKVIYFMHGGGHVMGSAAPTSASAPIWSGILEHCSGVISRVFCLDFRLSSAPPFKSKNPFPASIMDALSGYRYLIEKIGFAPEDIIVGGDSSGAHLAVVLLRYLSIEKIPSLPLPRATILLSPAIDWGLTHYDLPFSSMTRNSQTDFVRTVFYSGYTARAILGSLPSDELKTNPWLSPASLEIPSPSGMFIGFPQTWMMAGSLEQSVDPMRTLRDRLANDIGEENVTYLEYPEATHDLLTLTWHEPERTEALKELRKWIQSLC